MLFFTITGVVVWGLIVVSIISFIIQASKGVEVYPGRGEHEDDGSDYWQVGG